MPCHDSCCKEYCEEYYELYGRHQEPVMDPRKPLSSAFDATDSIISVHVGAPNAAVFHVHSKKLSSSSQYFQLNLKPHWKGNEDSAKLPEQSPDAFHTYSSWLYTGAVHTILTNSDESTHEATHLSEFNRLANAYVLGEYLQATVFQDAVMDSLLSKIQKETGSAFFKISAELVNTIYDGTPGTCPARLLMADVFANHAGDSIIKDLAGELPADFLRDLAIAYATKNNSNLFGAVSYNASKYRHSNSAEES